MAHFSKIWFFLLIFALPFIALKEAKASTCNEVKAYAKEMNRGLPVRADEVTTIVKVTADCSRQTFQVRKLASIPTMELDKVNPLWKTTMKRGFEKLVCQQAEFEALTAYGWKISQIVEFTDGQNVFSETSCSYSNQRQAQTNSSKDYSKELAQLESQRRQLQSQIASMQAELEYQKQARKQQYNGCYSNCLLNNRAGSGFGNALGGMAQCANSCRPLLYGGAASQPNWGVMQNQLESVECRIRQINERNFSASCSKF